jgi:D-threonate/D-erythronate kinase
MKVRIVADDLTGALDAAAPLAALAGSLPVFWQRSALPAVPSFALDTESRDVPPAAPAWLDAFGDGGLAYKKIDSLLRGNTAHEVAACLASGRFASALIAPAFPAQQRITRGGRQYWRPASSQAWQPVACDLAGALRATGIDCRHAAAAADVRERGCFLCDAETDDDLLALVAAGERLAPPVLWVGSAGLARALAGRSAPAAAPPDLELPLLMVIGSHHPVTLTQIRELQDHRPGMVVQVEAAQDVETTLAALAGQARAALVMAVADGTGAARAQPFFDRVLAAAANHLAPPRSLVVSGGATLHRLVSVLGARSLLVTGEPLPGVPRSVLQGGRWDGAVVISKSGGFGEPRLLIRLADCAKG